MRLTACICLFALCCFCLWCAAQTNEVGGRTGMQSSVNDASQWVHLTWDAQITTNYSVQFSTDASVSNPVWTVYTNLTGIANGMMGQTCYMVMGTNATFRVVR